jgi:hypothetical protein
MRFFGREKFAGNDDFLGLFVIGWDVKGQRPLIAVTDEPWNNLTIRQESEVFKLIGELALDVAPFTLPEGIDEFLEE